MNHRTLIKIRGYHLDGYGHVNNARYLEFLEEARWALIEERGGLQWWQERELGFVVVKIVIHYRRPAGSGDVLQIDSEMAHLGGKSGVIRQTVLRRDTGEKVANAEVTFVVFDVRRQKATPISEEVREMLRGG